MDSSDPGSYHVSHRELASCGRSRYSVEFRVRRPCPPSADLTPTCARAASRLACAAASRRATAARARPTPRRRPAPTSAELSVRFEVSADASRPRSRCWASARSPPARRPRTASTSWAWSIRSSPPPRQGCALRDVDLAASALGARRRLDRSAGARRRRRRARARATRPVDADPPVPARLPRRRRRRRRRGRRGRPAAARDAPRAREPLQPRLRAAGRRAGRSRAAAPLAVNGSAPRRGARVDAAGADA